MMVKVLLEEKYLAAKTPLARGRMRAPSRVGRLFSRYPRLAGLVGTVVSLSLAALSIATMYDGRSATLAHESETSTNVVSVISGDIARNVEVVNLSLQAMVDGAEQPSVMALPAAIRTNVLFDRSATALHLGGAFVMDRSGTIIAASDHNAAHPGLYEDRDYFRAHERSASTGLFISHPYLSRLRDGSGSVAFTRRINGYDGAFAGIAVVALHTEYFQSLLERVSVGPAGSVFIVMEDGTLLARKPFVESAIGRRLPGSFPMMATRASGSYTARSAIDGVRRIVTYAHVPGTPFIVAVAPAEQDVLRAWHKRSAVVGALTVAFSAIIIALAWILALILRERVAAQAELVRLAGTDSLTGLQNRRVLDSRLQEEWRRARRNSMPLSVLFVDIDNFKSYNDTYGHAMGDEAWWPLRIVLHRRFVGPVTWPCGTVAKSSSSSCPRRHPRPRSSSQSSCAKESRQ